MVQGNTLIALQLQTTMDGQRAYYGPSNSPGSGGKEELAFFEVPRSPTMSLGAFQHCDITLSAYGVSNQIGNSWASPYLPRNKAAKQVTTAPSGQSISPGLVFYDHSYLANEALWDGYFFSGASPQFSRNTGSGSPAVWETEQITETVPSDEVIATFMEDPAANPLRNPRLKPWRGGKDSATLKQRLSGPQACLQLAAHVLLEGGFNVNSADEEAWCAVLASLRGVSPAKTKDRTPQSRFRHITGTENDPWMGFRTLGDNEIRILAREIVAEVKTRGPFLSLGEFVNRRLTTDALGLAGTLQTAIDRAGLNQGATYADFAKTNYPNPENIPLAKTGVATPGWLTQADLLNALGPFATVRSDTFVIRAYGEARKPDGTVAARAWCEALVQRLPGYVDPADDASLAPAELQREVNKTFGRRFTILSFRELRPGPDGSPA
jgi:hypothetical protein